MKTTGKVRAGIVFLAPASNRSGRDEKELICGHAALRANLPMILALELSKELEQPHAPDIQWADP
jgi:hypothetical protein